MRIAMAQMAMGPSMEDNLQAACAYARAAQDCDLLLFPEIQLTPFFPQYPASQLLQALGTTADRLALTLDSAPVARLRQAAADNGLWLSPNLYIEQNCRYYDMSLMIDHRGDLRGTSKMVHIHQAAQFYERDYYTPSEEGFAVYDTPFGRVGVVICFDRHLPESIRTCAARGADLVLIPTANLTTEPLEMFAWELRVQAYQNAVCIAMCNRVGREGNVTFAGESLVVDCDGNIVCQAGREETLVTAALDLAAVPAARQRRPYLSLRRPDCYE
jgi:N-carbamoylputrescine amidase